MTSREGIKVTIQAEKGRRAVSRNKTLRSFTQSDHNYGNERGQIPVDNTAKGLFKPLPLLVSLVTWLMFEPGNGQGYWQGREGGEVATNSSTFPFRYRVSNPGGRGSLRDVFFWNAEVGWVCGSSGVFQTQDGGWTWIPKKPRPGWGLNYYRLQMTGSREIWLLEGIHGQAKAWLWHSTDDGSSWAEVLPGKLLSATDLVCRGNLRMVLCGDFTSYWSLDQGKSWAPLPFLGGIRAAIPGDVRIETGFVVYVLCAGSSGHRRVPQVFKSTDSGRSWRELAFFEKLPRPRTIFFSTSWQGWMGLEDGVLLATKDGGESWIKLPFPERRPIQALWCDSLGRGYVAVDNSDFRQLGAAVFATSDGGKTWQEVLSGAKNINGFFSLGPDFVCGVGNTPGPIGSDLIIFFKQ